MSEALAEGVGAGEATAAVVTEAPATEAPPVEAPAAAPAATPVWDDPAIYDLVDSRAQQLFQEQMGPLMPLLQQIVNGNAAAPAAPGELNPWEDGFGGSLDQRFQGLEQKIVQMAEAVTAPLAAREQAETIASGEERLKDILADDISRNGDFPTDAATGQSTAKELVRPLADMFFPEFASRFGQTPRAAEFAMQKAAGVVRQLVNEVRTTAVSQEANRLTTLAGVQGEPGAGGVAGVTTATDGKPLSGHELALKYGQKANALRG